MVGFWLGCFEARSEMPQYVFKCPGFEQLGTPLKKKKCIRPSAYCKVVCDALKSTPSIAYLCICCLRCRGSNSRRVTDFPTQRLCILYACDKIHNEHTVHQIMQINL